MKTVDKEIFTIGKLVPDGYPMWKMMLNSVSFQWSMLLMIYGGVFITFAETYKKLIGPAEFVRRLKVTPLVLMIIGLILLIIGYVLTCRVGNKLNREYGEKHRVVSGTEKKGFSTAKRTIVLFLLILFNVWVFITPVKTMI